MATQISGFTTTTLRYIIHGLDWRLSVSAYNISNK